MACHLEYSTRHTRAKTKNIACHLQRSTRHTLAKTKNMACYLMIILCYTGMHAEGG